LHLARASQYAAMGNQKDALADRDQAVRLKPDYAETHSARADSYLQLGMRDEEIADRNAAIHLSPDWPEGWLARGRTYFLHGEYSNALGDLNRALELKPDDAETRLVMVKTLEAIERSEAAAKAEPTPAESQPAETASAEPKAIEAAPTVSAASHNKLGRDLLNAHKYREAILELSEAIRLQPMFPQALNGRGFTYYLIKDYAHALADFDQAIVQDPKYVNAYHNRAQARLASGDAKGAAQDSAKERELSHK
jgi:tetratricopeptide (TPR) repeat protein